MCLFEEKSGSSATIMALVTVIFGMHANDMFVGRNIFGFFLWFYLSNVIEKWLWNWTIGVTNESGFRWRAYIYWKRGNEMCSDAWPTLPAVAVVIWPDKWQMLILVNSIGWWFRFDWFAFQNATGAARVAANKATAATGIPHRAALGELGNRVIRNAAIIGSKKAR